MTIEGKEKEQRIGDWIDAAQIRMRDLEDKIREQEAELKSVWNALAMSEGAREDLTLKLEKQEAALKLAEKVIDRFELDYEKVPFNYPKFMAIEKFREARGK